MLIRQRQCCRKIIRSLPNVNRRITESKQIDVLYYVWIPKLNRAFSMPEFARFSTPHGSSMHLLASCIIFLCIRIILYRFNVMSRKIFSFFESLNFQSFPIKTAYLGMLYRNLKSH